MPNGLVDRVEAELDRLVNEGIFEPIAHFDWASPIVLVIKPDGSIRICGDYKQTINRASDCDKYPLPRTKDLFSSLGGSEKFIKLNLSHVYQQLVLTPERHSLLIINTHKGLF